MADEGFKRKLTAILSTDVVGYSHMMEDDEPPTVPRNGVYRDIPLRWFFYKLNEEA